MTRRLLSLTLVLAAGLGCATATKIATEVGVATGRISADQAASINKTAAVMEKTFEELTPEQEHYIGRSVAATLLGTYRLMERPDLEQYVNTLGLALAQASDRPETFAGYRFAVLDTEEINAFAAPGGLILVSKGLLRCCDSEEALAAVLAHEIGHVERAHGLKAIKKGRLTSALTTLAVEAGKNLGTQQLADVTKAFEGSIGDITSTLVNTGYSRELEFEADAAAVRILQRVGYAPEGLVQMLEQMGKRMQPGSHGFGKTHPAPAARLEALRKLMPAGAGTAMSPARTERFRTRMGKL